MTFGLKNVGATYQKAIQKCFKTQIGKNVEAYVDDVVIKTTEEDKIIADLTETLAIYESSNGISIQQNVSLVSVLDCSWASWSGIEASRPT
jgi:hypothetical protein